jgi:hypothetical protein
MKMKQPVHKTDGRCGVECNPAAPGGSSLGSVMKQHGDTGPAKGAKALPNKLKAPMKAGGGPTEQPQ